MEKFKVKVTNKSEVFEIEKILSTIGLIGRDYSGFSYPKYMANNIDGEFSDYTMSDSGINKFKLLTINELKDMVVLKRNDVGDATHTDQDGWRWYIGSDSYVWQAGNAQQLKQWDRSSLDAVNLKPIKEEVMKEYLVKTDNGNYLYTKNVSDIAAERVIKIPQGANVYARCNIFGDYKWLPKIIDGDWSVLWQREKESINDKVATAEVARQEEKHSHYKKNVSHLNVIDPYRIADLYALHPCAEHIVKKSLCAGNRGHKDTLRDIQDIIDTAERWKQMIEEDNNEI